MGRTGGIRPVGPGEYEKRRVWSRHVARTIMRMSWEERARLAEIEGVMDVLEQARDAAWVASLPEVDRLMRHTPKGRRWGRLRRDWWMRVVDGIDPAGVGIGKCIGAYVVGPEELDEGEAAVVGRRCDARRGGRVPPGYERWAVVRRSEGEQATLFEGHHLEPVVLEDTVFLGEYSVWMEALRAAEEGRLTI